MNKRVLILAPHPDDGELGCGGTIARFAEEGAEVRYLVFCSSAGGRTDLKMIEEHKKAIKILGVPEENVMYFSYSDKFLEKNRQDILDRLSQVKDKWLPDLVIAPSSFDVHQDHKTVHQESLRCFKKCSILGMEATWNNSQFNTSAFVKLEKRHVEKKIEAVFCFQSQIDSPYINKEFLFGLASTRGIQVRAKYAEAFEAVRVIISP